MEVKNTPLSTSYASFFFLEKYEVKYTRHANYRNNIENFNTKYYINKHQRFLINNYIYI